MSSIPRQKYEYLGAGVFTPNHHGIGIYIRYRDNANKVVLKEVSSRHLHIQCPDRDLWIVGDGHHAQAYRPPFSFDEFVNVSPVWPGTGADTGINHYMLNFTQYLGKEYLSPNMRINGRLPEHKQTIYCDSGGFQIQAERYDYISPINLIDWYNRNVDVGMVLDFPPKGLYWPGLIERMAEAQRQNIEIMMERKRPDLEIMNIFHGENIEDLTKFRNLVDHPGINKVAVGGAYFGSILRSIENAAHIMTTGRKYEQYHMLGVSNIRQLYLIMRMASKDIAPYITSDSSTFLQEGLNKGYMVWPTVDSPPRYYQIGDKGNPPNVHKHLTCSCPVCRALKYQDVFNLYGGNILGFLGMYHNLYAFTNLTRSMYEIIHDSTAKDLKSLLRSQLSTRANGRDEVLSGIDFVDHIATNGLSEAQQKLAYFLGTPTAETGTSRTLFTAARDSEETEGAIVPADDPRRMRMERILSTYISETPQEDSQKVDKKNRIRQKDGHQKETVKAAYIPGKTKAKPKPKKG